MAELHNAKDYKLAKQFCRDIEAILKVTGLALRALEPFKHYRPVSRLISTLKEESSLLEAHLNKYKKIKKEKGKFHE